MFEASQFFTIDVADSFIAMKTGYALTEVPRRGPRVTWSDEAVYVFVLVLSLKCYPFRKAVRFEF